MLQVTEKSVKDLKKIAKQYFAKAGRGCLICDLLSKGIEGEIEISYVPFDDKLWGLGQEAIDLISVLNLERLWFAEYNPRVEFLALFLFDEYMERKVIKFSDKEIYLDFE